MKTSDKLDKDRFRRDMGGVTEAYAEVARRLGIHQGSGRGGNPVLQRQVGESMKAKVHVSLKAGVLDPQGKAVG